MSSRPCTFTLTSPGALRLYSTAELLQLPPPSWLIHGIMPTGGLVGLVGQPGTGKSFIAIDMALSVATGRPWQGRHIEQGFVLYVSAEGGTGIAKRVQAWLQVRSVHPSQTQIGWLTESVPVYSDSGGMDTLIDRVQNEIQEEPTLVIIDTLARCFDGDENQQEDMGRFVAGVDRLRKEFDATVIVVHHTRVDGERERGNTAFKGAADTMLFVKRPQPRKPRILLSCYKQKDDPEFEEIELQLKPVAGTESCVIAQGRRDKTSQRSEQILQILLQYGPLSWDEWLSTTTKRLKMSKMTFNRHLAILRQTNRIAKEKGKWVVQ